MSLIRSRATRWVTPFVAAAMAIGGGVAVGAPAFANTPVTGAGFTTTNTNVDGTGHCVNGNEDVNCNIYDGKQYVWLNGGPSTAYVGDGTYFFAVLDPGGQADPNDGALKNLSDGANGDYTDRTFSVAGGTVSYSGSHDFDSNKIRLMPYDDTTNPGGVYIMAICSLADGYPVDASSCKYDAFKVQSSTTVPNAEPLTVTKDANGDDTRTYAWTITKDVDKTKVEQSGGTATFNYTVNVGHDGGQVSGIEVTGTIDVFNPNEDPVAIDGVTDQLSDGTVCTVTGGGAQTVPTGHSSFPYTCAPLVLPQGELDNTAAVSWSNQALDSGAFLGADSADFTFTNIAFTETAVDNCVNVTDTVGGSLGTVCVGDPNPTVFSYSHDVTGTAGTCTSLDNTATFTTNTTGTTVSDSKTVQLCVGADLTVTKTATPSFTRSYAWDIKKAVDKTVVKQIGGTATFNYTVNAGETGFTDSAWTVSGSITVTNPNDWEDVTLTSLTDQLTSGQNCTVTAGTLVVPKSSSISATYSCPALADGSSGTNTATGTWDAAAAFTPHGTADGTADYSFATPTSTVNKTVTITDTFNGTTTTLGTLTATDTTPYASASYQYSHTVNIPTNNCVSYPNTATIVETGQTAGQTVKVCGPAKTGALTMGYWQNKNGQAIITGQAKTGVCPSGTWLRQYAPFQDLSATATCAQVGTYVLNVIKAANASGSSMNAMLKAQMLATSLDVYFSDPTLGGNKIGAPAPIGGVAIDLTKICKMIDGSGGTATCSGTYENVASAFGGATSLTVSAMLAYAASQSNAGGSVWYGQVKATQELAKNAFDAINNQVAFGA